MARALPQGPGMLRFTPDSAPPGFAQDENARDGELEERPLHGAPVLGHRPRGGDAGLHLAPGLPEAGGEVGADRATEAAGAVPGECPGAAHEGTTVEAGGEVAGVLG